MKKDPFVDSNSQPYIFYVNKNEVITKSKGCVMEYVTIKDLNLIKKLIDNTLNFYDLNNATDKSIKKINKKKYLEYLKESNKPQVEKIKKDVYGYVYLMQNTKTKNLKIGFSKNPKLRLKQLNNASESKIKLIYKINGCNALEKKFHNEFHNLRMNGEWFKYSDSIVNKFKNS